MCFKLLSWAFEIEKNSSLELWGEKWFILVNVEDLGETYHR